MVLEFILDDQGACRVDPVNGAPKLGTPGDFTQPRQYLVTNTAIRPDELRNTNACMKFKYMCCLQLRKKHINGPQVPFKSLITRKGGIRMVKPSGTLFL